MKERGKERKLETSENRTKEEITETRIKKE